MYRGLTVQATRASRAGAVLHIIYACCMKVAVPDLKRRRSGPSSYAVMQLTHLENVYKPQELEVCLAHQRRCP